MMRIVTILLFFISLADVYGKDTYFRGFYHGQNVFVRNSYLGSEVGFCIEAIYLNGTLVAQNPNISAYEIPMDHLEFDSRVVIRITHQDVCQPELANPEVIEEDLKFSWLKVYVNEEQIIWVTTKEGEFGYYIVQKEEEGAWQALDTVKTKGGIFINQHSLAIDHIQGDNHYRVIYFDEAGNEKVSESFNFHSDKREISHVINEDNWVIEFTEEVSFLLYNENSRIIKRGKDVSCDIKKLPRGIYTIKYDGKEVPFEKK